MANAHRIKGGFIFFLIISLIFYLKSYQNAIKLEIAKNIIYFDSKCEPIYENIKQFTIKIDGIEYPKFLPLVHNKSINFDCLNKNKNIKKILLWNKNIGSPLMPYSTGIRTPFEEIDCPVTNCELTTDRANLNQSSLVLFHLRNSIDYFPSIKLIKTLLTS